MSSSSFDTATQHNISLWLNGNYDEATKQAVRHLIDTNPQEATDAFYSHLSFGTGGMRGVMGLGSNRMNEYTIRAATQGLANYVNQQPAPQEGHAAFIGYDSRHHSKAFAEETAKVLAANGIHVHLCKDIRPTPFVSFGCRLLKCTTAVMITASHNPPQYNGYKVYWSDGGQVLPPHDVGIMAEVEKIQDPAQVKTLDSLEHPLISFVGEEVDLSYLEEGKQLQHYCKENQQHGSELKIVYTSLHGTGITLMPQMLARWGFSQIAYVEEQIIPNGDFPTATYPNPEEKKALELGIAKLSAEEADILIATDPDADRIGLVVRHEGDYVQLNGNQVAAILLAHLCDALTVQGKMAERGAFIKTIVTTELFQAIADDYGKKCVNVLPGFKYIAQEIFRWEQDPAGYVYLFGGEESCGYLVGTIARDKDGITAGALACEAALHAKLQGKTLVDLLHDLYRQYGVYDEGLLSLKFDEGKVGQDQIEKAMKELRLHLPDRIGGEKVVTIDDYLSSTRTDRETTPFEQTPLTLPTSDVLTFWLEDGTKLIVRPSGTEPKIKLYCGVTDKSEIDIAIGEKRCKEKIQRMLTELSQRLK